MFKRRLIGALVLAASVCAVAPALQPVPDQVLKAREHQKLGKNINEYFTALDESKGISESFEEIVDAIAKMQKKHKDNDVLSFVDDWEQAFYYARNETLTDRVPGKGKIETAKAEFNGKEFEVAIHAPKKYTRKKGPYPLIITVPDEGESPKDHIEKRWIEQAGRDTSVIVAVGMPAKTELWTSFDPQGELDGIATILRTFGWMAEQYAVDLNRVFLVGSGRGADAAHAAAAAIPHFFAGMICWGNAPAPEATNFGSIPTLLVNAGAKATEFEAKVTELEYNNCTVTPAGTEADIWEWMGKHSRNAYPGSFVFSPTTPYTNNAYWLGLAGVDVSEGPRIEATIDREANSVTLAVDKITSVSLYFNDNLIDMDRPVKIIANGVESETLFPRNPRTMVSLAYRDGDWGRVFTNVRNVDIPTK